MSGSGASRRNGGHLNSRHFASFGAAKARLAGMGLAPDPDERALHGCKEEINMLGLANERRPHFE